MVVTKNLSKVVGKNYDCYWTCRNLFRICKGSRASKKSKTTALWYIYHMMKYPQANTLVVRKVERTLKDSCYTDLLWAMDRLGVRNKWKCTVNPLEMRLERKMKDADGRLYTNVQKILFRGMDDPQKITSIAVEQGVLCWGWFEEAYQITDESLFNMVTMSIRGDIPEGSGLFFQYTLTFNPWRENWIKKRFFDNPKEDVFT